MLKFERVIILCISISIFCLIGSSVNAQKDERRKKDYEVTQPETKLRNEIISSCTQKPKNYTGNLNIFWGRKKSDKDDWLPVDKHRSLGIEIDFKEPDWIFSMAAAYLISEDDSPLGIYNCNGETSEIQMGIKKILDSPPSNTHPFLGGGLTFVRAKKYITDNNHIIERDTDNTIGLWVNVGCYITIHNNVNIGFNIKYSSAKALLNDMRIKAGGLYYGVLAGFHF